MFAVFADIGQPELFNCRTNFLFGFKTTYVIFLLSDKFYVYVCSFVASTVLVRCSGEEALAYVLTSYLMVHVFRLLYMKALHA